MRTMRNLGGIAAAAALLVLAACGGPGEKAGSADANRAAGAGNSAHAEPAPPISLATDGLMATSTDGRSEHVMFGSPREMATAAVLSALGAPTGQGTNSECGAGPLDNVDFRGALTLFFQEGRFVGWNIDGRDSSPYKTASGVGIGTTLQQLRDSGDVAVQDTSLGVEFHLGDISGLLTVNRPDGTVTSLWAGATCVFR